MPLHRSYNNSQIIGQLGLIRISWDIFSLLCYLHKNGRRQKSSTKRVGKKDRTCPRLLAILEELCDDFQYPTFAPKIFPESFGDSYWTERHFARRQTGSETTNYQIVDAQK